MQIVLRKRSIGENLEGRSKQVQTDCVCDLDSDDDLVGVEIISLAALIGRPDLAHLDDLVTECGHAVSCTYDVEADAAYLKVGNSRPRIQVKAPATMTFSASGALLEIRVVLKRI